MSENKNWCPVYEQPSDEVIKQKKCMYCWWCTVEPKMNAKDNN